jgi:hypothetical protein
VTRQIVFESKPEQIQSEIQIIYKDPSKGEIPDGIKLTSELAGHKKKRITIANHNFLCSEYQLAMMSSISLAKSFADKPAISVLVLGTGAGTIPMFLQSQLGPKHIKEIVTVDISEDMVKVSLSIKF